MIRLTVTLIVAIYIVLLVVPPADHAEHVTVSRDAGQNWLVVLIADAEAGAQRPPLDRVASAQALRSSLTDGLTETDNGFALETADGEQLDIAAVINPVDLLRQAQADEASAVASVSVAVATHSTPDAPVAEPQTQIWRVAAAAVNFREGPSTNTRVLTSLRRGEEVIFLASAPDNWARLRIVNSGIEGYMAAQFLEPAT